MTDPVVLAARLDGMVYRCPVAEAAAGLADVAVDELAGVVLDPGAPWWRRRLCAGGLHRRVPERHAEALLAVLVDGPVTVEVQTALVEVLATAGGPVTEPLLAWLVAQDHGPPCYSLDLAVLRARAALGDPGVVGALVRMASGERWFHREGATAVLDEIGRDAVLDTYGVGSARELIDPDRQPDADVRLLGVRLLDQTGGDLSRALADPSPVVARAAYDALAARGHEPGGSVERVAAGPGPGRLWALAVLHRQGLDITTVPAAVAAPRVELPTVPPEIRAAIVRHYVPGERRTDPRWLVELAFADPVADPAVADVDVVDPAVDVDGRLRRARSALDAAGLSPGRPVPAGELHDQGEGTYHQIMTAAGPVEVSTLGPFFRADDARVRTVLRAAGLRPVDGELAGTVVDGLCVYHFGHRDPLPVGKLLFYWQD